MCGIAGIFSATLDPSRMRPAAERMQQALAHRGPDDAGLWQSTCGQAVLAHRRLSIIDLSSAGKQPMSTADGRLTICFNGEIYNYRELRAGLERDGAVFSTTSDTEVILHLYARDGADGVKRLRGMFAFAIWDEHTHTAFLARDPLGIKPLYFHHAGPTLAFASELRSLTQSELFAATLNTQALQRCLETGTVPEPITLINEAQCLEAGQSLTWHEGRVVRHHFWHIDFSHVEPVHDEVVHFTRSALEDSIRHHFVSDVPVGIFLSGGIDSTALLALATATGHQGCRTFSIAVDDEAADESPVARRTARHFGSDHHEMRLDAEVARKLFEDFVTHLDQPSIDGFNTFTVSSLARQHGMKVVLSGLGGDEMFGGYASFQKIPTMLRWHGLARHVPGLTMLLDRGKPQHRRLAEFLRSPGTVDDAYASLRAVFSKAEAAQLTTWITGQPHVPTKHSTSGIQHPVSSIGDEISLLELTRYMRNQLLRDSDVMSMAQGLELRVPFVDRVLLEAVARIPAATRLQRGKRLLTQAVPEVPEWVVNQKKRGFLFPFQKWLGGEWSRAFDEAWQGSPVPVSTWYQKWNLFMLRRAMKQFGIHP